MSVKLIVDEDGCIGSGECVAEDPDAIEIDDNGCARVLIATMDESRAQRLCDVCPVGALTVER
jgi:ferredoxin